MLKFIHSIDYELIHLLKMFVIHVSDISIDYTLIIQSNSWTKCKIFIIHSRFHIIELISLNYVSRHYIKCPNSFKVTEIILGLPSCKIYSIERFDNRDISLLHSNVKSIEMIHQWFAERALCMVDYKIRGFWFTKASAICHSLDDQYLWLT